MAHVPVAREESHVPRSSIPVPSTANNNSRRRRRRSVIFARDDAGNTPSAPVKKDTIPEATVKRDVIPDANVKRDVVPEPQVKRDVVPEPEVKRDVSSEVKRDHTTTSAQHTKRDPIRLIASFKYAVPRCRICSPANEALFLQTRD